MRLSFAQIGQWLCASDSYTGFAEGFRQDSRLVQPGDLFFAMSGEKVDGHLYLQEVAAQGAMGAVVSTAYQGEDFGLQLFRVPCVLTALHTLARQVHQRHPCRVIGVTGSVGKTTTKEFIATLIEGTFVTHKTPGNANSQVGMPLSLLNARGDEEVFVAEMGMSQPHEIEKLVSIAPPEIAVLTQIALSHVAFFPDGLEGIALAKAEIFSSDKTRCGVVSHQALQFASVHRGKCCKVSYGPGGDFAWGKDVVKEVVLPFSATHLCENALAAICVARLLGVSWEEIVARSTLLRPFKQRFEQTERQGIVFVNDAYNANPTSMRAALSNLPAPQPQGKRIAVLGAMKELGAYEVESHVQVAKDALEHVDHLLCFGRECEPMVEVFSTRGKPVELFVEQAALKHRLFALARGGDVVLLKGSNSNRLWQLLD